MNQDIQGIHHITAIAGDPQVNLEFYAGILGLRMLKKTVNFDAPGTYHFYYGDYEGTPGTILTFFPWGKKVRKGRPGAGQAVTIAFSVPKDSSDYWENRLTEAGVEVRTGERKHDGKVIAFSDPDGTGLEIVASDAENRPGLPVENIPDAHTIRGFHSVALAEERPEMTGRFSKPHSGFRTSNGPGDRMRFVSGEGTAGTIVDILLRPGLPEGVMGAGAVHHVAFRTGTAESQRSMKERLEELGNQVTRIMDRQYFTSVYFREPGSVLFEIATDPPGFTTDEDLASLGSSLKLPPWLEPHREEIERALLPVSIPVPYPRGKRHEAA